MSLQIGQQLGSYKITSLLGKGGMGEVYRARDLKLKREVAIKVLPDEFSRDSERVARFQREAEVVASLNHPHIAAIYHVEQAAESQFLVLELVEGETLADRIGRGPIPVDEALELAKQIAEALEAAHERGIIHRDLKPANIKITPDGKVKVLDFGLAKAFAGDSAGVNLSEMPTETQNVILGTPAYMSPEQARGQRLDKRTDIWAFGCVFYEMLNGRRAFHADTVSDVIAAILAREPDWDALPDAIPSGIRRLLQRCLEKDAKRRLRDIGEARIEIEETFSAPPSSPTTTTAANASLRRAASWSVVGVTALSALMATILVWNLKPAPASSPESEARFMLQMPAGIQLPEGVFGSSMTISRDGGHLTIVGRRGATLQLYLRTIQDAETKALPETEGAAQPFFSPDGRWIAFFAGGKLKKVPTNGGLPVVICDAPSSRGGFWSENGTIVFSPQARGSGIFQISADGGVAKQITTLDIGKGETSHRLPELLPGDETVLFTAYGATYQDVSIVAQSLKTGERRVLIEGASQPHYVSTRHLLYVQPKLPGSVMAVAFDPERLKLTGTPVPVVDGVLTDRGDSAVWSLSRSGMLVYAPGGFQETEYNLVFVDRNGVAVPVGAPPQRPYHFPRLSPDGHRVVVTLQGIQNTLWTFELASHAFNRLTFEGNNDWAIWTPDGKRITYASNRAEPWRLFWKPFDGSAKDELLLARGSGDQQPDSWSPDGKVLVYQDATPATAQDIWVLPIDGDRQPRPLLQTPASEVDARLSPDGLWLAYASDESGRYEVYVLPFAGSGGKWQISTGGGREPVWAHNGRELFYRSGDNVMVAEVTTQPSFQAATSHPLFQGPYRRTNTISPEYDITPDDQRFLMVQPSEQRSLTTEFNVVLNWLGELKRRVPVR